MLLAIGLNVSGFFVVVYLLQKLYLLVEDLLLLSLFLQLGHKLLILVLEGSCFLHYVLFFDLSASTALSFFISLQLQPLTFGFFCLHLSLQNLYPETHSALLSSHISMTISSDESCLSAFSI